MFEVLGSLSGIFSFAHLCYWCNPRHCQGTCRVIGAIPDTARALVVLLVQSQTLPGHLSCYWCSPRHCRGTCRVIGAIPDTDRSKNSAANYYRFGVAVVRTHHLCCGGGENPPTVAWRWWGPTNCGVAVVGTHDLCHLKALVKEPNILEFCYRVTKAVQYLA